VSKHMRRIARRVSNDLCGVSVYGDGLSPAAVVSLAKDYLKLTAHKDLGWVAPVKSGLFKWQCTVCKRKYFRYDRAFNCCINK